MKRCPFCAEEIQDAAIVCKHCGRELATGEVKERVIVQQVQPMWKPGVAAVLSLVIPGAGQMYKGQVGNGIVWLIVVVIGYVAFIVPGLLLHLCCVIGASMGDPIREAEEQQSARVREKARDRERMDRADERGRTIGRMGANIIHGKQEQRPPVEE